MMYFTPGFELLESDVEGYVSTIMSELNQGYANSGIPLKAELFCMEKLDLPETMNALELLQTFALSKGFYGKIYVHKSKRQKELH